MRITSTHHTRKDRLAASFALIGLCLCQLTAPTGAAVTGRLRYPKLIFKQGVLKPFDDAAEIIDTAKRQATSSVKPNGTVVVGSKSAVSTPPQAATELSIIVYAGRSLIGLTHGQTLRVNALYPGNSVDPQRQSVWARVSLYDANATLLSRSAEATIVPGTFHSFDFDRADISAAGEPAGGRLQIRVSLEVAAADPSSLTQALPAIAPLATSLELIDNNTGRTFAVWVTVGFFEVVPPRNPQ